MMLKRNRQGLRLLPIVSQVSRQPLAQLWLSLTNGAWNGEQAWKPGCTLGFIF